MINSKQALLREYESFIEMARIEQWERLPKQFAEVEKLVQAIYPYHFLENGYPSTFQLSEYSFRLVRKAIKEKATDTLKETLRNQVTPLLEKLLQANVNLIEEEVIVGIYHPKRNPIEFYSRDRVESLEIEAKRQGVKLYYFSDEKVDIENKIIQASYFINTKVEKKNIPYPQVIYNLLISRYINQTKTEYYLRKDIPFLAQRFGDKVEVPKLLLQNPSLSSLVIPFIGVLSSKHVIEFLDQHFEGILKPAKSARGESIYYIEKISDDEYLLNDRGEDIVLTKKNLENWIQVLLIPRGYLLQKLVKTATKDGAAYDIRALVLKNGCGQWSLASMYPRVARVKEIVTTLDREQERHSIFDFLNDQFGVEQGLNIYLYLEELSLTMAEAIDNSYNNAVAEMGVDLAIDVDGKIWSYEANNKPATNFTRKLAEDRAINMIAYAKYIGKNQIFPTNEYQERVDLDSTKLSVDHLNISNNHIGLMISEEPEDVVNRIVEALSEEQLSCTVFTMQDIDIQQQKIHGKTFINEGWQESIIDFPTVILDRVVQKGVYGPNLYYQHFDTIKMTTEIEVQNRELLKVYEKIKQDKGIKSYLPFEIATVSIVQQHLSTSKIMVLYNAKDVSKKIEIKRKSKQLYTITEGENKSIQITYQKLLSFINKRFGISDYIIQKNIDEFILEDMKVHFHVQFMTSNKNEPFEYVDNYITYNGRRQDIRSSEFPVETDALIEAGEKVLAAYVKENKDSFYYVTLSFIYDEQRDQLILGLFDPLDYTKFEQTKGFLRKSVRYAKSLLE